MRKKGIKLVIILVIGLLLVFGAYQLMNLRTYQLFGELTSRVDTDQKAVALTFDDGPTDKVELLLPLLDRYHVKATFFLIGNELEKNPDRGRQIAQAGHQIGNHTYSHNRMVFKTPSYIKNEIEKTDQLIRETGYKGEIAFRPPYGKKLVALPYYLMKHKKQTITWNVEPDTYYSSSSDKVDYVKNTVSPGSIILMHPMYDDTGQELKAIEEMIQALREEGYTFVTVDELKSMKS